MTNEAADILRKAKELIETKGWCRRDYAVGPDGKSVSWADPKACGFCMSGALYAAYGINYGLTLFDAFEAIKQSNGINEIVTFNDAKGRKKPQILRAFDRAIALAEAGKP